MNQLERRLFVGLGILALVALTGLVQARSNQPVTTVPIPGGVYREGVVTTSRSEIDQLSTALTHIGLVRVNGTGAIEPDLAETIETSDDAQTIRLTLPDGIDGSTLVTISKDQASPGYWQEAEISAPEPKILEFHLARPWAGFVSELTAPIFPYGPYQIDSSAAKDPNVLVFGLNPNRRSDPYLEKIELHLFDDPKSLERSMRKRQVDGAFLTEPSDLNLPSNWADLSLRLRREHILFFNLRRPPFDAVEVRQKLLANQPLPQPISARLLVPDTPALKTLAEQLKTAWAPLHLDLEIDIQPTLALTKTILPERDFDAVLLGVDYGPEGDLFPYWHSSQMASPGQNIAGFRNKEADRLLDGARRAKDPAERASRYRQVRSIISDQAAAFTLESPEVTYLRSNRIKGAIPSVLQNLTHRWTDLKNWSTKERRVSVVASDK